MNSGSKNVVPDRHQTKRVVLFSDTFMNYSEPSIGKAAVELLEACGFEGAAP